MKRTGTRLLTVLLALTLVAGVPVLAADEVYFDPVQIVGGRTHSMALYKDGTVWAWGDNSYGQLGNGSNVNSTLPVQVIGLADVVEIASSPTSFYALALKSDGTVWAWGRNNNGQLGNGTTIDSNMPVQVSELSTVIQIAGGREHTLALKNDGTVWAWGRNDNGQLGDGTKINSSVPVQVQGLTEVSQIDAESVTSHALKSDGTVWGWGLNEYGQIGDGTTLARAYPTQSPVLSNIVQISNHAHCLAVKDDGTVWSWGYNVQGQTGSGATSVSIINPFKLPNIENVTQVLCTTGNSYILRSDGTVWTCGANGSGQLGNGTTESSQVFVQVDNLTDVISIGSGSSNGFAIKSDDTAWAWGGNQNSQLGDYTTENRSTSVQMFPNGVQPPTPSNRRLSILLEVGEDVQLSQTYNLADNLDYTWRSDDPAVATVDANGRVTAAGEGECLIYAEKDGYSDYIPIRVVQANADDHRLAVHLTVGGSANLWLADSDQITWTSDATVASVTQTGRVTGVARGLTVVQAELEGEAYHVYVRVA